MQVMIIAATWWLIREAKFLQVIDGYFVHFTEDAPDLEPLPKYTIFVLDVRRG